MLVSVLETAIGVCVVVQHGIEEFVEDRLALDVIFVESVTVLVDFAVGVLLVVDRVVTFVVGGGFLVVTILDDED